MINDFFLTEWFFDLLRWLYSVLGNNYFLTIFIVTLALRIIQILPDINNRKNQRKQAKIQPEIEKLKKKYADNPQKLSMEQNKLMRENGIGMLSSCLPLLLTLPLFFCFLAAFRFWGYEQTVRLTYETIVNEEKAQETFDSYSFLWITNIWQPDSGFAPVVTPAKTVKTYGNSSTCACTKANNIGNLKLFHTGYTDAAGNKIEGKVIWKKLVEAGLATGEFGSNSMDLLPTDTAVEKYDNLMKKYQHGNNNGWFILPVLATGFQLLSAWLSMRQSKKLNPGAAQQQQSMNFMLWLFPIMSFFVCLSSTSAFSLYWVLSSVLQIITSQLTNLIMSKKENADEVSSAKPSANFGFYRAEQHIMTASFPSARVKTNLNTNNERICRTNRRGSTAAHRAYSTECADASR